MPSPFRHDPNIPTGLKRLREARALTEQRLAVAMRRWKRTGYLDEELGMEVGYLAVALRDLPDPTDRDQMEPPHPDAIWVWDWRPTPEGYVDWEGE